jgi:replicative DNA helicase
MILSNRDQLEKELCAAVMLSEAHITEAMIEIKESDFMYTSNRNIFTAIKERWERDNAISYGLMVQDLIDRNIREEDYLEIVNAEINDPQHLIWFYILDNLRKQSKQDELKSIVSNITQAPTVTPEQMQAMEKLISESAMPEKVKTNKDHVRDFIKYLGGSATGVKSGLPNCDEIIGGFVPGKLYICAGRPGMGKSALAHQVAYHVAGTGEAVMIVTAEMTATDVLVRLISRETGIPSIRIQRHRLTDEEMGRCVDSVCSIFGSENIRLIEAIGKSWKEIAAIVHAECLKRPYSVVILDQLQSLRFKGQSLVRDIGYVTKGLRVLADKHKFAALMLCQLSRAVDRNDGGIPRLADLRDSGDIEQDADVVIFIHDRNEKGYEDKSCDKRFITVAKNRFGAKGRIKALFYNATTTFVEGD